MGNESCDQVSASSNGSIVSEMLNIIVPEIMEGFRSDVCQSQKSGNFGHLVPWRSQYFNGTKY